MVFSPFTLAYSKTFKVWPNKSSPRWCQETGHKVLTLFLWHDHFISKISHNLLVHPCHTQSLVQFHVWFKNQLPSCSCK